MEGLPYYNRFQAFFLNRWMKFLEKSTDLGFRWTIASLYREAEFKDTINERVTGMELEELFKDFIQFRRNSELI